MRLIALRSRLLAAGRVRTGRWRLGLAAAFLVLAQVAAFSHLVGHVASGDGAACAICVGAADAGNALPAAASVLAPPPAGDSPVTAAAVSPPSRRFISAYRSRAPPASV